MEPYSIMTMQNFGEPLSEGALQDLYGWVDQIPLSRPKKSFARDFSDAVHRMLYNSRGDLHGKIVELHNYPSAGSIKLKIESWRTLNRKVLKKLEFEVSDEIIEDMAACKPFVIERVLMELRKRIDGILWRRHQQNTQNDGPESDQYKPKPVKLRKPVPPKAPPHAYGVNVAVGRKAGGPMPVPNVVPVWKFDSVEQESRAKDETIKILQTKVAKMEQLLQLKDLRISELTDELGGVKAANTVASKRRSNNETKATKSNHRTGLQKSK